MFEPKLGVSLTTIITELNTEVLCALEASRIETLELKPRLFEVEGGQAKKDAFKEMLRGTGIRVSSIHAPNGEPYDFSVLDEAAYEIALEGIVPSIDLAIDLNAPIIVVHPSDEPIAPADRQARMRQAQKALAQIAQQCREHDKKLVVELLPRTCLANTAEEVLELIEPLDDEVIGVCLDTNHLMDRYRTLPDVVRRLGKSLIALHLSDYDGVDEKHEIPGSGVIDWKAFMGALAEIDYRGPFSYEYICREGKPAERIGSLEANFQWLCSL